MIEKPVVLKPKTKGWEKVGIVVFVLFMVGVAIGTRFDTTPSAISANLPAHTIGEDVTVGTVRWKVVRADVLGSTMDAEFFGPAETSGQFVQVTVEIENVGSDCATLFGVELIDKRARSFATYGDQYYFIPANQSCALETLNPNLTKTCTFIFEVPGDVERLRLKATDLEIVNPELKLIDLGVG